MNDILSYILFWITRRFLRMKKEHILRRLTGVVATLFTAAFVTVSLPGMINEVYAYDINNKAITGLGAGAISNPDPKQPGSWCYVYYGRENGMERK